MSVADEKPIRVLQFIDVPEDMRETGYVGYRQRLDMLAKGLTSRGCIVDRKYIQDLKTPRVTLSRLLGYKQLRRMAQGYDAIHAAATVQGGVAALAVRDTNIKLIYDIHGDCLSEIWLNWQHSHKLTYLKQIPQIPFFERLALKGAHGLLVVSKPSFDLQVKRGVPPERILLTRNGVDMDFFKKLPDRKEDGVFRLCYSGGFAAWQGMDNLLNACQAIKMQGWPEKLKLRMIGLSASNSELRRSFAALLGSSFEPVDRVSREEMYQLFNDVDMLVIPRTPHLAVKVAMPTKFAEYIASGRPVLVTDVDETADLVRQYECGIVAEPTAHGLAKAIINAVKLPSDELVQMGNNARDLSEKLFSWDSISADYYEFLMKILGRNPINSETTNE